MTVRPSDGGEQTVLISPKNTTGRLNVRRIRNAWGRNLSSDDCRVMKIEPSADYASGGVGNFVVLLFGKRPYNTRLRSNVRGTETGGVRSSKRL